MFLIKLLIGVACVVVCLNISKQKVQNSKNYCDFYESLIITCDGLIQEVSYKKRPISYLLQLKFPSKDFEILLKNYVKNNEKSYPNYLTNDEIIKIDAFLSEIGKSDAESQKTLVNAYKSEFERIKKESLEKYKNIKNVSLKVGFSLGVMLFIMVI